MFRDYIILYMDAKDELNDCDRDTFEFIIHYKDQDEFDKKLCVIFEENKLVWNGHKDGYKNIFGANQVKLTNIREY